MQPLVVTAHLRNGFAATNPWSPSLDGILAYWLLREHLGEEDFALAGYRELVVPDLPLERVEHDGTWWWACSSPQYEQRATYLRWYHRRFDHHHAERFATTGRSGRVMTSSGPYKEYRNALTVHVTPSVTWHAIGDRDEITRLLQRCTAIGAGVGQGHGRVARWEVTEGGNPDLAHFARPVPVAYALAHGITGMEMDWGIQPPGRSNPIRCVMP